MSIVVEIQNTVSEVVEAIGAAEGAADGAADGAAKGAADVMEEVKLSLTTDQETVVVLYYDEARTAVEGIVSADLPTPVKVTKMIATLMKLMERIRYNDRPLKGADKKAIVMELVHRLVKDLVKDRDSLFETLASFHSMAEHFLETLVDISHHLAVVEEVASGCCAMLFK